MKKIIIISALVSVVVAVITSFLTTYFFLSEKPLKPMLVGTGESVSIGKESFESNLDEDRINGMIEEYQRLLSEDTLSAEARDFYVAEIERLSLLGQ